VLEKVVKYGTLHEIHINNMADQHEEFVMPEFSKKAEKVLNNGKAHMSDKGYEPSPVERLSEIKKPVVVKALATVAVAAGDGLKDIFESLGVDACVIGGQTLNPSIKEIADAIEATGSKEVIVLPNNKNVILTARQAADLVKAKVHVIPSKSMQQGMAAMMGFNSELSAKENEERMNKGLASVTSGEITYAIRDTKLNGIEIKQNDFIGIIDGQLLINGTDLDAVTMDTLKKMVKPESEIITVFYGQDVEGDKAQEVADRIQEQFGQLSVELHPGGQPVYYYLLSVE
jgi:dihydroxyacetone kinase-like predicted kinase